VVGFESSNAVPARKDEPVEMVVLSDGTLVAAGLVPTDEQNANAPMGLGLLKLTPGGAVDNSFGSQGNGRVRANLGLTPEVTALERNGMDQLYVVVNSGGAGLVLRYGPNGLPQPFPGAGAGGAAGLVVNGQSVRLVDLQLLPDGRFVAAGEVGSGSSVDFLIARWNANGTLDSSFGAQIGYTRVNFALDAGSRDRARRLVQRANGGWLVGGTVSNNGDDLGIAAFNADGQIDSGFTGVLGQPGRTIFRFDAPLSDDLLADLVELPSGRLMAYAHVDDPDAFARNTALGALTPDGFPDNAYAPQGRQSLPDVPGFGREVPAALLAQPDGAVIAVSTKYSDGTETQADVIVRRVLANGSNDQTFGNSVFFNLSLVQFAGNTPGFVDEARSAVAFPGGFFILGRFSQDPVDSEFGFAKLINSMGVLLVDGFE
jgi:uncharacterized delta-60 repeat protein